MKVAFLTHADGAHMSAYLSSLASSRDCTEVVLADPTKRWFAAARKTLGDKLSRTYTDYDELLRKEEPRLCMVSLEARTAPPVIKAALTSGAHVFSEKPGCVSLAQFEELANLAESKHLNLMMAFANRANPESLLTKKMIRDGELGKLYSIDMHIVADQTRLTRPAYHNTWFADKDRAGGGHLIWLGIHWLDLSMFLTGSTVTEVTGAIANVGGQPLSTEDSATATLKFSNGILGTLNSGYYLGSGYHTQIRIWGEKGWVNLDSIGSPKMIWSLNHGPEAGKIQEIATPVTPRGYTPYVEQAITAIATETRPPITTQESLNTMRTVFGIYSAAETGSATAVQTVPVS